MPNTKLDARKLELVDRYLVELYAANARLNLTSVPREDAQQRHVDESLALLQLIDATAQQIVDVGSGGGIPGVIVAITRPDCFVTLVEADQRKAGFLIHVCGLLLLSNVSVVAQRAEIAGNNPRFRENFDLALSRAAGPIEVVCELCLPLVRVGGRMVAVVSDVAKSAARCEIAAKMLGGDKPNSLAGVLTISKIAPTPERFPRKVGIPTKRPLR